MCLYVVEPMTGQEIRDLGYLSWKDPWAWMETMKGKRWNTLIQQEKAHYHELSSQPHVARTAKQMKEELAQSNLATLDTAYVNKYLTDFPAIDLYFDLKQGRKHIHIFHEQPPSEIDRLLHLIDGFEKSINWKNTN